ncbi:phosphotransferase [Acholeplasma hippikon]|uniref:CTP:phosphocholine cytidylyltransferase involved in choline phosphorylation for cell surface LPS epitopes n=1 Tax=Acholeplasma hippikon TaxID=264636 RepID=A0A449BJB3_9MOLU|nr:phosphotransferase [Acholeplasma hippikon]VEU82555.1 CTP:phosphocholine cytidylyltransferase involved in choline phosphorylation for cell surface LPS epitopes [Acholeplasma hippikon]
MLIEEQVLKNASDFFKVSSENIKVDHRLKGGMSNYTYLVYVLNEPYVIRIIGEKGEVLVNPKKEKDHLALVKDLGITSETLFLDVDTGAKISRYIDGEVLSGDITITDYMNVATTLKKLHQSKISGHDYELKDRLRSYEKLLTNRVSQKYYLLKLKWLKMYDEMYEKNEKVFCHGDAQRSNLIRTKEGIQLLDFEFSGMNDPYYDIASFGNISFEDSVRLLGYYLDKEPTFLELNKLKFYRMYQVLQWHIVATYKDEVGLSEKLHLDFKMIAEKYLNMAEQFYFEIME